MRSPWSRLESGVRARQALLRGDVRSHTRPVHIPRLPATAPPSSPPDLVEPRRAPLALLRRSPSATRFHVDRGAERTTARAYKNRHDTRLKGGEERATENSVHERLYQIVTCTNPKRLSLKISERWQEENTRPPPPPHEPRSYVPTGLKPTLDSLGEPNEPYSPCPHEGPTPTRPPL